MAALLLAPMEGLLDHPLREVLTAVGGIDRCVSEFIRVSGRLMPDRVFTRIVPELLQGGCTRAGRCGRSSSDPIRRAWPRTRRRSRRSGPTASTSTSAARRRP
jgi:tRNA-dihydrouridine synthase